MRPTGLRSQPKVRSAHRLVCQPSAVLGVNRGQPAPKKGALSPYQQPAQRPRSELPGEAHLKQRTPVVDGPPAPKTQPATPTHSNGHANGNGNGHGYANDNGHRTNGHSTNGHSTNGHSTNGHSTNGHSTNGHTSNGHSTNGHTKVLQQPSAVASSKPSTSANGAVLAPPANGSAAVAAQPSKTNSALLTKPASANGHGMVAAPKNGTSNLLTGAKQKVAAAKPKPQSPIPAACKKVKVASSQVLAFILGGGQGSQLYPLTDKRAEPAVPLFGSYRLIDVPISNCLNSSVPVNKIYVLTQYNSTPLNRHLSRAYGFVNQQQFSADECFVEPLNATLTNMAEKDKDWFQGTADAVRHYAWTLQDPRVEDVEDVLILSGDQIYRMDYTELIQYHRHTGAAVTMGCTPCTLAEAKEFGVCTLGKDMAVQTFTEKPSEQQLRSMAMDTTLLGLTPEQAALKPYAANMGVYVFKKNVLLQLLAKQPDACDFGRDIITCTVSSMDSFDEPEALYKTVAYPFKGYWRDVGSLKAYYDANLDMTLPYGVAFPLRLPNQPLYSEARVLPPAKLQDVELVESIVGHGSLLRRCHVRRSVLGDCSTIREHSFVEDTIMFGSTYDDPPTDPSAPQLGIGSNCRVRRAILDRNVRIGNNCTLVNGPGLAEANHPELGYVIREGIICVLRGATIAPGTTI